MSAARSLPSSPDLRLVWALEPTTAGWVNRPTLRMDRAGEIEAAREVAEFHRTGSRADLNTSWKRTLIHMGVLSVGGFPGRER